MGGVFEPITLNWEGTDHTIPSDKIMGLIMRIERVVTLKELLEASGSGHMPMARISSAYGEALRYAGASVTDEQVYAGMFAKASALTAMQTAIVTLLGMMVPPSAIKEGVAAANPGNRSARRKAAANSSGKRTKSRS